MQIPANKDAMEIIFSRSEQVLRPDESGAQVFGARTTAMQGAE
jgi:hypothetical protein